MSSYPRRGAGSRRSSSSPEASSAGDNFTDAEVATGQEIRCLYVRERSSHESRKAGVPITWEISSRWDGRPGKYMAETDDNGEPILAEGSKPIAPIWPKIARVLMEAKIQPSAFISYVFSCGMMLSAPEPNQLTSQKFLDGYAESRNPQHEKEDCQAMFNSQRNIAHIEIAGHERDGCTKKDAYLMTSVGPMNHLTPLFRYCLAARFDYKPVMDLYFEQAAVEFCRGQAAFEAVWGQHLPAGFREQALRYYDEMFLGKVPDHADAESRPE
jgi:hypothetical protein